MVEQTVITTEQTGWTIRTRLAFILGKLCIALLQLAQWLRLPWGGTAFPGRVVLKIDRNIVATLRRRYHGLILVTGTNGKTSTTAQLVQLLQSAGLEVVSNPEGANMVPGLVTALLKAEPIWPPAATPGYSGQTRLAVLEVDEGSLLSLSRRVTEVDMVIITNLFPDQLDRYGSVNALAKQMKKALAAWRGATLVLNADDPLVASFGQNRSHARYFAVETADDDPAFISGEAGEVYLCPLCGQRLHYSSSRYAHLGCYACSGCDFSRPRPSVIAWLLPDKKEPGTLFLVRTPTEEVEFYSALTGLYNVYNTTAALAATVVLQPKTKLASLTSAVAAFRAPAGRTEYFSWPDRSKQATLVLVKNPAGFNQALTTLADTQTEGTATTLIIAINDLPADGRDVSWLWDTYIDAIAGDVFVICSGRRARDVAVCLKYNGLPLDKMMVVPEVNKAVREALTAPAPNIIVLCNYTVLAPLRQALVKQGGKADAT